MFDALKRTLFEAEILIAFFYFSINCRVPPQGFRIIYKRSICYYIPHHASAFYDEIIFLESDDNSFLLI